MSVLVTGGTGYIGSHTCVELLNAGFDVIICDNLSNSKKDVVKRIESITGKKITFYQYDLCDEEKVKLIFEREHIDSVIHFAGLKAVGESVKIPLAYYENNILSTITLLKTMLAFGVRNIVFSSSATVYAESETMPLDETMPLSPTSPYGRSKLMIEQILEDACAAEKTMNCAILRYFNPVGAHESGLIGEDPSGIPNNLMPYITQVAIGKLEKLRVYGNDYNTTDGTGVRDYIHVTDLSKGHLKAMEKLDSGCGLVVYNLGGGTGYSVFDMIKAFEKASGRKVNYEIASRRQGDLAIYYSDPGKAFRELNWKAEKTLSQICEDSWRWQSQGAGFFDDKHD